MEEDWPEIAGKKKKSNHQLPILSYCSDEEFITKALRIHHTMKAEKYPFSKQLNMKFWVLRRGSGHLVHVA